jgi:hypothetical protein
MEGWGFDWLVGWFQQSVFVGLGRSDMWNE